MNRLTSLLRTLTLPGQRVVDYRVCNQLVSTQIWMLLWNAERSLLRLVMCPTCCRNFQTATRFLYTLLKQYTIFWAACRLPACITNALEVVCIEFAFSQLTSLLHRTSTLKKKDTFIVLWSNPSENVCQMIIHKIDGKLQHEHHLNMNCRASCDTYIDFYPTSNV